MKLKFTYTFLTCLFMAFLFMGNSGGRADVTNWGNTGAPGDEMAGGIPRTCMSCHNTGTSFQVTLDIIITNANGEQVVGYTPGEVYNCRVMINKASGADPSGYGFQIVNLFDSDNSDVNLLEAQSDNVKIAFANNTGKWYGEQNGVSSTNQFDMVWTAPPVGSGPVTFYSCGNGINGNGSSGGDAAACNTLTLNEGVIISTKEIADENALSIFPNPVIDLINIESKLPADGNYVVSIYNQLGQLVVSENKALQQNEIFQLDVAEYTSGVYTILLENEDIQVSKRFLKN